MTTREMRQKNGLGDGHNLNMNTTHKLSMHTRRTRRNMKETLIAKRKKAQIRGPHVYILLGPHLTIIAHKLDHYRNKPISYCYIEAV